MNEFLTKILTILEQFSTAELGLAGVVSLLLLIVFYMLFRMRKLSFNYYAKSVSKTVEAQTAKILELEKQLGLYARERSGVVGEWAKTRVDRSAHLLSVYNDTPDRIFNVKVTISPEYQAYSKVFHKANKIDSQKALNVFFVPGGWNAANTATPIDRSQFLRCWLDQKLKPIIFTVMYTETPSRINFKSIEVPFKKEQLTEPMKRRLELLKVSPQLAVVPENIEK